MAEDAREPNEEENRDADRVEARDLSQTITVAAVVASDLRWFPACARTAFEAGASLPTPAQAAAAFARLTRPAPRIERLIRESCRCYELGAGWLAAARRDAKTVPALDRAVRLQDRVLGVLIQAALGDWSVDAQTVQVIKALIDFPFWKALTDAGVVKEMAPAVIYDLVRSRLQKRR